MFRLNEPSSGQIQIIVLIYSVSVHIMGSHAAWDPIMCALNECISTVFCIWPDDGSLSRNMSPNF